jgi:hypothetical protein
MDDLDFIDKKHYSITGEMIAEVAYGVANSYISRSGPVYIPSSSKSKYLYELERSEIEKELNNSEESIKSDLEKHNTNYNSRLEFSLINNMVNVDLDCENIVYQSQIWDGNKRFRYVLPRGDLDKFSLYDIYVKIEKKSGDFTKKDLINLIDLNFYIEIGGSTTFQKDFFSMCFFELIDEHDIFIESNIIYLKAFTFENMFYGIPYYFLSYHDIAITAFGLNSSSHSDFKIDAIYSGKNLSKINIKPEHKNLSMEQVVFHSQNFKLENKIVSGEKIKFLFNHPVQMLMIFLYNKEDIDELSEPEINSIGISLNNHFIWWENEELIEVDFMGINLYMVCIDPQLQNYNKFCDYVKYNIDPSTLKSINFSRIDDTEIVIEYDSDFKYEFYMKGLNTNVLRMMSGMAGLAFCP